MRDWSRRFSTMFEMIKNPFDNCWVFDTGDDLDGTTAVAAGFDIDLEHPFEALGHRLTAT